MFEYFKEIVFLNLFLDYNEGAYSSTQNFCEFNPDKNTYQIVLCSKVSLKYIK